jgi:triosephosphate isomerase
VRHLIVGNWKMHHTIAQTDAFIDALIALADTIPRSIDVGIAPPFTSLPRAAERLRNKHVLLCAQNVHWAAQGAFTGEISAPMLAELGVEYVIVGHSERREYFGETDATVHKRVAGALRGGLKPIVCVGESLAERKAGRADERVTLQTRAALEGLSNEEIARVTIAYEPVWAIGTGENCQPDAADATMTVIRKSVRGLANARILYGGSAKPENIAHYTSRPNINGALVGGASLDASTFATLIRNAAEGIAAS